MMTQLVIITISQVLLFSIGIVGMHLHYKEKIEQIHKEYQDGVTDAVIDIEDDYQKQLDEKRINKKLKEKLKIENGQLKELISYMKKQAKENRLYKKYFKINNNNYES